MLFALAAIVVDEMELRLAAARIEAENTERRRVEEALRAANQALRQAHEAVKREQERYQELFIFAPDGYLVTEADGLIREANTAAAQMLNIPPERLAGKPVLDFVAEQERHDFRTQLRRLQTVDQVSDWEVRLKPRGGTAFFAALTGAAVRNHEGRVALLRWMMRDVTERKRAEQERYRLLTSAVGDHAVLLLDGEGRILSWTADAERIMGWSGDTLQGQHVSLLYPAENSAPRKTERSLQMASSEGRFDEEGWFAYRDGFRFWARMVIMPTRDAQGRRTVSPACCGI
jgi:PAS domain S-box-containing protein